MIAIWAKLMIGAIFVTPMPHGGIIDHPPIPAKTQCIAVKRQLVHGRYVIVCTRRAAVTCTHDVCVG